MPHGPTVEPPVAPLPLFAAAVSDFSDLERLTRVTPCTLRRRDISGATPGWVLVQPASSMAGELIALRMPEPPPAPPPPTVPLSELR